MYYSGGSQTMVHVPLVQTKGGEKFGEKFANNCTSVTQTATWRNETFLIFCVELTGYFFRLDFAVF